MYECIVGLCMPGAQEVKRRVLYIPGTEPKDVEIKFFLLLFCFEIGLPRVFVVDGCSSGVWFVCLLLFFGLVCICFEIGAHCELVRLARFLVLGSPVSEPPLPP